MYILLMLQNYIWHILIEICIFQQIFLNKVLTGGTERRNKLHRQLWGKQGTVPAAKPSSGQTSPVEIKRIFDKWQNIK